MPSLKIHSVVVQDLAEIRNSDVVSAKSAADRIGLMLREFQANPEKLVELAQAGDLVDHVIGLDLNVLPVTSLQKADLNIWRLKILDLERVGLKYRVLYARFAVPDVYVALAVQPREFNYEPSHPCTQRVIDHYDRLKSKGWTEPPNFRKNNLG